MSCFLSLGLCLGLFLHRGEAGVRTEAQAGPLYRAAGSPLSISCNVSGFARAGARKEFEYRVRKRPDDEEHNVISTASGRAFSYAAYSARVRSADVTLTHSSPNSVVFGIRSLRRSDGGEYECAVINSEAGYDGSYSAKTTVEVIDNSLSASSPGSSTSLTFTEGDVLTLTCHASSDTVQHTHLSLAWHLRKEGEGDARLIIALDRDFTLRPGAGFEERHGAGLISLDKRGDATYELNISHLEQSDQGGIYCRAQEWIQDPDRSWYSIAQKDAEETTLKVKPRAEVVPDASAAVAVRISARPSTLQEGQGLSLSCSIDTEDVEERFFSVAWLKGNVELARVGPTGIVSVGPEYGPRAEGGELRAARTGARVHRLELRPVGAEDRGEYACRAWPQDRGQGGAFTQGAAQDSASQAVSVASTDSFVTVKLASRNSVATAGENVELMCRVGGLHPGLRAMTLAWSLRRGAAAPENIVTAHSDGAISWSAGQQRYQLTVASMKRGEITHYLLISGASRREAGRYQCAVSVFLGNARKLLPPSNQLAVEVQDPANQLSILKEETELNVSTSQNFSIPCLIVKQSSGDSEFQVTWSWQKEADAAPRAIFAVYRNATLRAFGGGDRLGYSHPLPDQFSLTVLKAGPGDGGRYFCEVEEWLPSPSHVWTKHAVGKSGYLAVSVYADGNAKAVNEPECRMQTWTWVLVAVTACALTVIVALVAKTCRSEGGKKSQRKPLWTEELHLNAKPSAED